MRELLETIETWRGTGRQVALATVVDAWGSSPRPLGSQMAISDRGEMAGSVSGGCVEGAVVEEALRVLTEATPRRLTYGIDDDLAWSVGLSCGGRLGVYVEPLAEGDEGATVYDATTTGLAAERPILRAVVIAGPRRGRQQLSGLVRDAPSGGATIERLAGGLGSADLEAQVEALAPGLLASFRCQRLAAETEGGDELFLQVHPPRRRLVIVGAVHVAIPLVGFARTLGFRTIVVDPRTAFATRERFPHADQLETRWPDEALEALALDENSYVALLSHDFKLDLPALEVALRRPIRYLGALGSKKTHGKRVAALRERGFDDQAIARIHNPIGLDLGGRRAEEIALAVMAEMVAVDHGKVGVGR